LRRPKSYVLVAGRIRNRFVDGNADDAVPFFKPCVSDMETMTAILELFSVASGLKVNMHLYSFQ
jgi:hypothetical protein